MKEEKEGYEFVSIAAHQLRGPIGSIRGYASMILDGDYGLIPDNLFEAVNLIFKAADSLNKTVNDFLDTSKMEQGQMRYYLKDLDLVELVQNTLKEIGGAMKEGVELDVHLTKSPIMVHADKQKLKHVIINLLDNAIKYTCKGKIELRLERKSETRRV
jgi:two-component system cell cycle sensor histidine kinase PleC